MRAGTGDLLAPKGWLDPIQGREEEEPLSSHPVGVLTVAHRIPARGTPESLVSRQIPRYLPQPYWKRIPRSGAWDSADTTSLPRESEVH